MCDNKNCQFDRSPVPFWRKQKLTCWWTSKLGKRSTQGNSRKLKLNPGVLSRPLHKPIQGHWISFSHGCCCWTYQNITRPRSFVFFPRHWCLLFVKEVCTPWEGVGWLALLPVRYAPFQFQWFHSCFEKLRNVLKRRLFQKTSAFDIRLWRKTFKSSLPHGFLFTICNTFCTARLNVLRKRCFCQKEFFVQALCVQVLCELRDAKVHSRLIW